MSCQSVLAQILVGAVALGEFHLGIGGQMINRVHARHRGVDRRRVQQIPFQQFKLGMADQSLQMLAATAAEIVQHHHLVIAGDQRRRQFRTNTTRAARD